MDRDGSDTRLFDPLYHTDRFLQLKPDRACLIIAKWRHDNNQTDMRSMSYRRKDPNFTRHWNRNSSDEFPEDLREKFKEFKH